MDSPQFRSLLYWNRFWLGCFLLVSLYAGWLTLDTFLRGQLNSVRAKWDSNELRFNSVHGGVVISHVIGFSNGTQVGAPLKKPLWILDSAPVVLPCAEWQSLEWRNDGRVSATPPPCGSDATGLYTRLQGTESRTR